MAEPLTDSDRLWGRLALAWKVLSPEQWQRAQQLANDAPDDGLKWPRQHVDMDASDRDALDWMVKRLEQGDAPNEATSAWSTDRGASTEERDGNSDHGTTIAQPPSGKLRQPTRTAEETPYEKQRLHATGGIGQVWIARDPALERDVALKELRPERLASEQHRNRFLFEAQVTGQLEHPGVVPVYQLDARHDSPSYAMRFFRGRTLKEAMDAYHQRSAEGSASPLEFAELLQAVISVCNTVEYAHSRSVIHRDLKGHNVVLGDFGEVIVLDWGLAKRHDEPELESSASNRPITAASSSATELGTIVGTPAYMSPEQACGQSQRVGPASDVYSLGVILFELIAGRLPFTGETRETLLQRVIHEPPPPLREVAPGTPRPLEAICLRALGKQPEDRYASAREVADDLRRFLADEPVSAYREPFLTRCARWARKRRTLVTSAAAVLVVAVLALSVGAFLLAAANRRTNAQRQIAVTNGKQAKRNFQRALGAVNELLNNVAQNKLLDVPGMHPLRRELLESALRYFEEFAAEDDQKGSFRAEMADAHYRIARIHNLLLQTDRARASLTEAIEASDQATATEPTPPIRRAHYLAEFGKLESLSGQPAKALEYYGQAIQVLEAHLEQQADDRMAKTDLAANLITRARLLFETRDLRAAEEVVRRAVDVYRELRDAEPDTLVTAVGMADAVAFRGALQRVSRDPEAATASFQQAIDLLEPFREQHDSDMDFRSVLSLCYHNRGRTLRDLDRVPAARTAFLKAIEIRKSLARDYPTVPESWIELAATYNSLGILHWRQKQLDEALSYYKLAVEQQQRLVADHPRIPLYRSDLASNFNNVAIVLRQRGKYVESLDAYQQGIAIRKQLLRETPDSLPNQIALASSYRNVGRLFDAQKDFARQLQWCDRALKLLQELEKQIGGDPRLRFYLARTHWDRAEALLELERPREAADAWGQAARYEKRDELSFIAVQQARAWALAGEHARSFAALEKQAQEPLDGETTYVAARAAALAAAAAGKDKQLNAEQKQEHAERYARQAVEWLQLAQQRMYPERASAREEIEAQADLQALRDRADYRQFVAKLPAKRSGQDSDKGK